MSRVKQARASRLWREQLEAPKPWRRCLCCDAEITRCLKPQARNALRFCSRKCTGIWASVRKVRKVVRHRHKCRGCYRMIFNGMYCTNECRARSLEASSLNRREYARRWRIASLGQSTVPCRECGGDFERVGERQKFCSNECGRRNIQRKRDAKRAARLKAARVDNVDPFEVFKRDGWKCRACGVATPRSLRGKNVDRSPELDHIMPLSLGGEHSYRNTQCLCRMCNQAKGATPAGQLSLL